MSEYPATQCGGRAPSAGERPGLLLQPGLGSAWDQMVLSAQLCGSQDPVTTLRPPLGHLTLQASKGTPSRSHRASSEPCPPMGSCTHTPHPAILPRSREGSLPGVQWPMANHLSRSQPSNATAGTAANMGPLIRTHWGTVNTHWLTHPPALGGRPQ